jgi:hypothetical protein
LWAPGNGSRARNSILTLHSKATRTAMCDLYQTSLRFNLFYHTQL